MTWAGWLLLLLGSSAWMYRRGYADGAETAKRLGQLAVERERARCRTQVVQRLYGPMLIARPSAAGKN